MRSFLSQVLPATIRTFVIGMCFSAIWIPENADLIWEMRYPISLVLIYIIWREIKLTIEQGQHDRQKC